MLHAACAAGSTACAATPALGVARPSSLHDLGAGSSPRCASSGTATGSRRCAAPARSPPGARARDALLRRPLRARPAGARARVPRSRPSCCTSFAATARRARSRRASSPRARTPASRLRRRRCRVARRRPSALVDAGCELDGYASDVTRTFPTAALHRAAARALTSCTRRSRRPSTPPRRRAHGRAHWAAVRVISQGLLDTGLLARDTHGDVDVVIESAAYRRFFMHGTGHWLGLTCTTPASTSHSTNHRSSSATARAGGCCASPRVLRPGMVVTLEPGLCTCGRRMCPERFWHIGIRIEDDAPRHPDGCEPLSRGVPGGRRRDRDAYAGRDRPRGEPTVPAAPVIHRVPRSFEVDDGGDDEVRPSRRARPSCAGCSRPGFAAWSPGERGGATAPADGVENIAPGFRWPGRLRQAAAHADRRRLFSLSAEAFAKPRADWTALRALKAHERAIKAGNSRARQRQSSPRRIRPTSSANERLYATVAVDLAASVRPAAVGTADGERHSRQTSATRCGRWPRPAAARACSSGSATTPVPSGSR